MNAQDKAEARAAIERASVLSEQAKQEVIGLAKGTRKWTMCIPLRQDDSDTLLMNTFRVTDELAAHLKAALDALEAAQARVDELDNFANDWSDAVQEIGYLRKLLADQKNEE